MTIPTVDLRSDTVTKPTPAMLEAMVRAPVGDDVYGEDPTVAQLESMVAELAGKEAAVFVPSGTMGNLIAVLSHCGRGDEMIVGDQSHIHLYEQGGSAALGGVHPRALRNRLDGTLDLTEVEAAIRGDNDHFPVSRLVCLETTHNRCGGVVLPLEYMDAAGELAHRHDLQLHVDGARLWNAAVHLGVSPARLLRAADSASLCLSKGLAAPVGSVVVGSVAFMRKVRRQRKAVGGGMRQAGVIAAAGIVAVTHMVERLADDHESARALAHGLAKLDGISVEPSAVQTNIVMFELRGTDMTATQFAAELKHHSVLLSPLDACRLRAVTHYHVGPTDIERAVTACRAVLSRG
jgi:threonine aldolase